jgi:hypothetical protein
LHKVSETPNKAAMTAPPPFGPGVETHIAAQTMRMEVWASSFMDLGGDFCEFRLYDEFGQLVLTKRIVGY